MDDEVKQLEALVEAYNAGRRAYAIGKDWHSNPFEEATPEWHKWSEGWGDQDMYETMRDGGYNG